MSKSKNAYLKNFDAASFKTCRPATAGIVKDKSGVYMTGAQFFEGDLWRDVEQGKVSTKSVFRFPMCKSLFTNDDLQYSHKTIINEESQWGMACYFVKLAGADPKTFRFLKQKEERLSDYDGYYFSDKNSVYFLHGEKLYIFKVKSNSPGTFMVHDSFAQDEKSVFFLGKKVAKADPDSFHRVKDQVYEDDQFIYENDNWSRVLTSKK